jgi:hypothetical protein
MVYTLIWRPDFFKKNVQLMVFNRVHFIFCLFDDAFNDPDYTESNDKSD